MMPTPSDARESGRERGGRHFRDGGDGLQTCPTHSKINEFSYGPTELLGVVGVAIQDFRR